MELLVDGLDPSSSSSSSSSRSAVPAPLRLHSNLFYDGVQLLLQRRKNLISWVVTRTVEARANTVFPYDHEAHETPKKSARNTN